MAACSTPDAAPFELAAAVAAGAYSVGEEPAAVRFASAPVRRPVEVDGERRPAVVTSARGWSWHGRLPRGARLRFGLSPLPGERSELEALRAVVTLQHEGRPPGRSRSEVLEVLHLPAQAATWQDLDLDLSRHGGRRVRLDFRIDVRGESAEPDAPLVAWAPLVIGGRPAASPQRPNILLVVVDTLRRDRLTPYGYGRETSPYLDRLVARRGATLDAAYAQAAWTLPSMASLMTGLYPRQLLGGAWLEGRRFAEDVVWGIPEENEPLAQVLSRRGYRTAAFVGHAGLRHENGFSRGFDTYFVPTDRPDLPAPLIASRARRWLAAHAGAGPFLLYLHFMDPHEPYHNPDLLAGRSPFYPGYDGPLLGSQPWELLQGKIDVADPTADVAHLAALYDSEVRYVDRHIGELLEAIPPSVMAETLVAVTADHGEELYDHGSWAHGRTLYDEIIRVPLLLRWDGRIPAGRRLAGTVRLLDLTPTLVAAAGGPPSSAWQGIDLMPALRGEEPLPRLVAYSQHLGFGPLRAAAVADGRKLALFNRHPRRRIAQTDHERRMEMLDGRLARHEVYDLRRDAAERVNLAGADGADSRSSPASQRLRWLLHRHLDRQMGGLRVIVAGLGEGRRLTGCLRLDRPPEAVDSYFLGEGDEVDESGAEICFRWIGDGLEKGLLIRGKFERLLGVEAEVDGLPLGEVFAGGRPWHGGPAARTGIAGGWPRHDRAGPALFLWHSPEPAVSSSLIDAAEEMRSVLAALGYVG